MHEGTKHWLKFGIDIHKAETRKNQTRMEYYLDGYWFQKQKKKFQLTLGIQLIKLQNSKSTQFFLVFF
jgi:hypothetical protein